MNAIVCTKYGPPDVLPLREVEKPIPEDNEILIKVLAATVTPGDCEIRRFEMYVLFWLPQRLYMGIFNPKRPILGMEVARVIEAIGKDATKFDVGDEIFGGTGLGLCFCRIHVHARHQCPGNQTNKCEF